MQLHSRLLPMVPILLLAAALPLSGQDAWGGPSQAPQTVPVTAQLVAAATSFRPGTAFRVGALLTMDPDWHVYWKNPGQSGLPVRVVWHLPPGWSAGDLRWPLPKVFDTAGVITYGYAGQVLLTADLVPPPGNTANAVTIGASVTWLACRVECIPGSAQLSLTIPSRAVTPTPDSRWTGLFSGTDASVPREMQSLRGTASVSSDRVVVTLAGTAATGLSAGRFFPDDAGIIDDSAPQLISLSGDVLTMALSRASGNLPLPAHLRGILAAPGASATELDVALTAASSGGGVGLVVALLFALLGGALLNLMPCVLPVLSIKVLALLRDSQEGPGRSAAGGLLYSAGVLASFLALGGTLVGLRAAGSLAGWGFQFQDPTVVGMTALLFCLIALNLFGVFEVSLPAGAVGAAVRSTSRARAAGLRSFLSGMAATAVATPCTAPFMAAALGYALTRPAGTALSVFAALGVGMAAPYMLLSAAPRLGARLPKPGRWMETLRQIMGFPMMAAVVWMLFVQTALVSALSVVALVGALLAAGAGAWVWGRWGRPSFRPVARGAAAAVAATLVLGAAAFVALGPARWTAAPVAPQAAGGPWQAWSPEAVALARGQGRPVFVDFTARWCLTCQVNEVVALESQAVTRAFGEENVATFRADWTDGNPQIARALADLDRAGVPVYALYLPGEAAPRLLPEVLTPGVVLEALQAPGPKR